MNRIELQILYNDNGTNKVRAVVNKWKFQDSMMGEQYLTFTITSEKPIDWNVGDFCVFRGQTYTLNYVPSVTQKAGNRERQDVYTYENVKFESYQEELTRCIMLDITATTGSYVAALGTNYTGNSKFTLFCGETSVNGGTLTAVCALAAKMQANLDRLYTRNGWTIYVDTTTSFVDATGVTVLATHTDDKVLTFDNTTVAQALAEVHNTFELDYCIRGREIYIGYNLKNLTSDNDNETFSFAYGKGYPTRNDMNKGLFQIKRISNPQQKIVTRLRALGSTKNMPYRYYNKKYASSGSDLSQTLFPTNLQLPDTFLPEGGSADAAGTNTKWGHNKQRDNSLAKVKGDTNDAYIDKNDDAAGCDEGIREDSARWDGSNGELPEIYPTIEEATYGELRNALVVDQDGNTGNGSFLNYLPNERIDKLLAIGYKVDGSLTDDANKGDGILPESGLAVKSVYRTASIGATHLSFDQGSFGNFFSSGNYYVADENKTLFTIQGVNPGKYAMAPTLGAVVYGFSLSCYRDGCSCQVGYIITIKQKNLDNGIVSTIATYSSDFVSINRSSGIVEVDLPDIPDAVNGYGAKVSEIVVTAMSDIIVEFTPTIKNVVVPSGFTDSFSISYQVGNSRIDHTVTAEPEYTWFPVDEENTITDRFHVFVQDMGFDFEACWSDETPTLVMKSGYCVGREFEILEDIQKVSHNGKKGYMLTLKRAEDTSINAYYPSETNPIAAGDYFVLLGIQMPDVYVKAAEVRLLRAATQFLADNCETKFTYQPYIDDIYLQRNYDNMVKAGTPEASVFWRLYAGLKFTFRGVPSNETDPLPLADITIEKVSITMGEGLTPKVELTLNDDVQQGTIQKLTTSVDRIYNGSIFSGGSIGVGATGAMSAALLSILQSEGGNFFLSKIKDDTAEGKITFNDVVTHNETLKAKKGVKVGNFQSRLLGSGALIDEQGNAEFESIYSRNFISTPEFRFNRISVTEGEQWCTNGYGTVQEVEIIDDLTGYITLKLEENDYSSLAFGDICRGIYNDIAHQYETASLDDDSELYAGQSENNIEGFGFSSKQGFFTSYFWIRDFVVNKKGECKFLYELRNSSTPHPCEFMKFAQYGSFTNPERRSSSYATSIGHYYEMVLDGVSTWKIQSPNVVYRKGYLGDMTIQDIERGEVTLKGYGLYVQDNVYFGNAFVKLDPVTLSDLEEELKTYTVDFSGYVDVITVDDVGNCIGGLWTVSGSNNEYRSYRIQSAITVRKSGNLLTLAANDAYAGKGTFKILAHPIGCTCVIENSTIYITGIDNIKDGVAGSPDDANFDYNAMRNMDSCYVDLIIDCEGKGSIQKKFPITIKHASEPFIGADISNEFSAVSWNTKTQAYIGLPIVLDMKMWHNNVILDIASTNDISLLCATTGVSLVNGTAPATPASNSIYYSKSIVTVDGHKYGRISLNAMGDALPNVIDIDVTCTAVYAGVSYERTLRHTINKSTDNNLYWLLPSVNEVGVTWNDLKQRVVSADKVFCSVRCDSTDDKHYTVATSDYAIHGLFITSQTFSLNSSDVEVGGAETAYSNLSGVTVSTDLTRIRFKLYKLRDTTLGTLSALLSASNVIEVLDIEDVPVILDGLDGDNSIFVNLDNANDAVMCIEDGTVIASTLPVAKARLMDGEETVGRSVLGTILSANKQTLGNWSLTCHGCTAEFVGWEADSDSNDWVKLRVTGVSEDVASVDVNCQYTKHGMTGNYVSILSVKKIYGLDKYELTFDPKIVSYNPNTDTYTPESFMVYVWKTTQEEDRHLMTSLPGNTSNSVSQTDGSIRLQYSLNKGVSWTNLYGYSSGKSIAKTIFDVAGVESVEFRIQKYVVGESGGEWVLLDEEGVEIVGDGENTIQLIIDNGNDTVMCIEDGTVIASTLPVANVYLYDGNDMVNTSLQASAWLTLECVGCTASWVSGYQSDGGKRFNVTSVTEDVAKVTAKVSYKDKIYSVVHNVKKLYGLDKYEIITDPVSIAYNPNTGAYTPTSFNVYVYLTTQEEDRHLMTTLPTHTSAADGDIRLQYSTDNGSSWTTLTGYSSGKTVSSSLYSSVTSGSVLLRVQKYVVGESGGEWVLLDEEGVEITRNGQDGKGVEYIFFQQNTETPIPTIYDDPSERQVDDYCPYTNAQHSAQWTDEPGGVGENSKYEFYALRKKVNGVWQPFGRVREWMRYTVDGVTPYMIDLSNEQSFINCDENGNVLTGASYETSNLMIFKGMSYAFTDFNISITPTGISCNGNSGSFTLTDAQKTTAQNNGYFILTPSAITQNSAQIVVTCWKVNTSIVLTAVYKINKNMGGQNGVIYALMPSINVVHKNQYGTLTNSSMNVQVKKVVGITATTLTTSTDLSNNGLTLKYIKGSSTTEYTISDPSSISTSTLCGTSSYFTLLLYKGSTVVDKERINVVWDGDDGEDGDDALNYELIPVPSTINFHSNGDGAAYTPSSVQLYCGYKKIVGDDDTIYPGNVIGNLSNIGSEKYSIFVRNQYSTGQYSVWGFLKDLPSASPTGILSIASSTSNRGVEFAMSSATNVQNVADSNIVARIFVPIIKTKDGDTGDDGSDGIFPRDCGLFDPNIATNKTFGYAGYIYRKVGDFVIRDKVVYEIDNVMWAFLVKNYSASALITAAPTSVNGDSNWESAGIVKTVIANTVFGTNANIGGFMTSNQRMRSTATTDGVTPKLLLDGQNGRIEAHEGLFTGFVRKKKTSITTSNINNYKRSDITSNTVLDFDKCGSFVELNAGTAGYLTLPLLDSGLASYYNSDQKDLIRSHIGANLLIHNKTGSMISFNTKHEDNGYTSYSLPNGMFVELRCRTRSDSATKEIVYWEVIGSGIIV